MAEVTENSAMARLLAMGEVLQVGMVVDSVVRSS